MTPAVLSVPSWVIPGTYVENLRFLDSKKEIGGVELLFFTYDDAAQKQLEAEWDEIRGYRERFVFTVHLPETLLPAHEGLVAKLAPLARHFIVHPDPENPGGRDALLTEWAERCGAVFLVENTFRTGNLCRGAAIGGLCMDTGHLLLGGESPPDFFNARRERVKEIHLHGIDLEQAAVDGRPADHRRLRGDEPWLLELLPLLKGYRGVINVELFSWEEAEAGIEILRKYKTIH